MSAIILLGAGASYGSGPCAPSGPPPLGNQLYKELQLVSETARSFPESIQLAFDTHFETGMAQVREHLDELSGAFIRDMGAYFAPFEPLEGNAYHALVRAIIGSRRSVTVTSLNYDLLLEIAICKAGWKITYNATPPAKNISVLKIHGSCNFLPDIGRGMIRNMTIKDCAVHVRAPVRVATNAKDILDFCAREDSLAPAMSLYTRGKPVLYCPEFVQQQQNIWNDILGKAANVYITGVQVNPEDTHIWRLLAKTKARLHYFDPFESALASFRDWANAVGRRGDRIQQCSFSEAAPLIGIHLRN